MTRDEDILKAIRQKDVQAIISLFFEGNPPATRSGFRTETELWDYKKDCPRLSGGEENAWADLAKDVLGFYNKNGGILFFGINETNFSFCGAATRLDSKLVNDQLRKYIGDAIWVEYHRAFIRADNNYLGVALIQPRGPILERFKRNAPLISGKRLFETGWSAIREKDSTRILNKETADSLSARLSCPILGKTFIVDSANYRILQPDYAQFIYRSEECQLVNKALQDERTAITSLIGIGGVGKTALATWAVLNAYEKQWFPFIISITAKDRELTKSGIQALAPMLTSFEALLDSVADVIGFPELKTLDVIQRENEIRALLKNSNALLFVDNLETVDDARIINFLDDLPVGVRAITTSRRSKVRVATRPIEVKPLNEQEIFEFIRALASSTGFNYCSSLSKAECARIGLACDGIPLAIKWVLAKAKNAQDAITFAEDITKTGRRGEELLEFCFRRVFEQMSPAEQIVLEILSLFQRPLAFEAIWVGSDIYQQKIKDALDQLIEDALVTRFFDTENNDYSYALLPVAQAFVFFQVSQKGGHEQKIRKLLRDYFEASDIRDAKERLVIRAIRQGQKASEGALVDLGIAAVRRGDNDGAQELFEKALSRNPQSWRAAKEYAEFHRKKTANLTRALQLYEQAAANAPRRGDDRAMIFREWGMLIRASGETDATSAAIEKFEIALRETPNDVILLTALGSMYDRNGMYKKVINILEPLANHPSEKTRSIALTLLLKAYENTTDMLNAARVRTKMRSFS
jgi:tetratricopeptide (TPR) repeat protein